MVKAIKEKENKTWTHKVIWSNNFFWFTIILMSFLAILQIILFTANVTVINGYKVSELYLVSTWTKTTVWLRLLLSGIGGVTATLGLILINRGDKKFYYFSLTTAVLLAINGFLSNLFFEGVKWIVVGIILMINTIIWNLPNVVIKPKRIKIIYVVIITLTTILITGLLGGLLVANIPETSSFYNSMPVLDPMQSVITIIGNFMMIFKILESRIIYALGNILTIVMFTYKVVDGDWVSLSQVVQGVLYLIVTISGFYILKEELLKEKK